MNIKCPDFKITLLVILIAFTGFGLSSCGSSKQLSYFKDLPDSTIVNLPPALADERLVENGDRLDIAISAKDNEAAAFFNKGGTAGATSGAGTVNIEPGYLVDFNGFVEFPIIGKVKANGLTSRQLKENLTRLVSPYLKEPLVDVRFITFRVTLLGEVRAPGAFSLNMQRTTLLDALAAGGDLPHSAKRYDVKIYRDYNGKRIITTIDLRKKDVLLNPDVFQLKHNDVIYVQPRPGSIFREDFGLFASVFTIIVSTVTLVFTILQN